MIEAKGILAAYKKPPGKIWFYWPKFVYFVKIKKKGDTLIEGTSGNTGIAFAMLAAERGYKMKIVMPSNMSEERKQMLKFYF